MVLRNLCAAVAVLAVIANASGKAPHGGSADPRQAPPPLRSARSARSRLLQNARLHRVSVGKLIAPVFLETPVQPNGQNYAYYAGNYSPSKPWSPNNRQSGTYGKNDYFQDNVYWKYFKEAWGDAPFADANFRLWLQGFFKNYDLPREAKKYQTTKSLPAWMHYYNSRYDPTLDPPYASDYALFGDGKAPEGAGGAGSDVMEDCSHKDLQRPCGVADKERWTKSKSKVTFADPAKPYVKIDRYWAKRDGEPPKNMPPPPSEPPSFGGGDKMPPAFSIGPAAGGAPGGATR